MAKEVSLPGWAKVLGPARIEVQAADFYPEILEELGIAEADVDQYWLEVAKAVMKMDVKVGIVGTDAAAPAGGGLVILVSDSTKGPNGSKWAQARHPEGRGAVAGAREAREHYRRIRGFAPV